MYNIIKLYSAASTLCFYPNASYRSVICLEYLMIWIRKSFIKCKSILLCPLYNSASIILFYRLHLNIGSFPYMWRGVSCWSSIALFNCALRFPYCFVCSLFNNSIIHYDKKIIFFNIWLRGRLWCVLYSCN